VNAGTAPGGAPGPPRWPARSGSPAGDASAALPGGTSRYSNGSGDGLADSWTVVLVDHVKRPDGQAASNALSVLGDGGLDKIDGTWRRVVLPLDRFTRNQPLQIAKLWRWTFQPRQQGADLPHRQDRLRRRKGTTATLQGGPAYKATARLVPATPPIKDGIYGIGSLLFDPSRVCAATSRSQPGRQAISRVTGRPRSFEMSSRRVVLSLLEDTARKPSARSPRSTPGPHALETSQLRPGIEIP